MESLQFIKIIKAKKITDMPATRRIRSRTTYAFERTVQ